MNEKSRSFDVIAQLGALRRYARSLVRNGSEAEDLVHDALVRAYERRVTFRAGANLRSWLFAILHNTHVDRRRALLARQRRDDTVTVHAQPFYPASQDQAVRLRQVREAFMALPDEQREALHLVAVEDMSYHEAADALDIPVGTLMSRVARARARLRSFEDDPKQPSHLRLIGGGND
jgi:RNA polymerase sigma-70 factor (ECF subfamily)